MFTVIARQMTQRPARPVSLNVMRRFSSQLSQPQKAASDLTSIVQESMGSSAIPFSDPVASRVFVCHPTLILTPCSEEGLQGFFFTGERKKEYYLTKELPLGKQKESFIMSLKDQSATSQLWVLQLFTGCNCSVEKIEFELEKAHKIDPFLQPDPQVNQVSVFSRDGSHNDYYYNIQRYIGPDWVSVINDPRVNQQVVDELLALLPDMASQLIKIHQLGFRHRDVRPENMVVSDRREGRFIDYGLTQEIDCDNSPSLRSCPHDWEYFLQTIERIMLHIISIPPDSRETLLSYCFAVREMIKHQQHAEVLNSPEFHQELLAPLAVAQGTSFSRSS